MKSQNPKSYILNSRRGFSLMELLIYTAILAVMSTVIVNVFLGITKGKEQFTIQSEVNTNLRFAIEKINQDIRSSSIVTTPAAAGSSSSSLVMTVGGDTITYCTSDSKLRRQVNGTCEGSSPTVTTNKVNVTGLTFTRFENTNSVLPATAVSIQTSITISYAGVSSGYEYSATKTTTELLP